MRRNLHRELMTVLVPRVEAPASRYGRSSPAMHRVKSLVKAALGRKSSDLYDLTAWTVWRDAT